VLERSDDILTEESFALVRWKIGRTEVKDAERRKCVNVVVITKSGLRTIA
jgi:hypothetical protein